LPITIPAFWITLLIDHTWCFIIISRH